METAISVAPCCRARRVFGACRRSCCERNYTGYGNRDVDKLVERQSSEPNREKRQQLVWEIEKRLAEDGARPVIFYPRQATCRYAQVKGLTVMVNSIYNGYRYEDIWLER